MFTTLFDGSTPLFTSNDDEMRETMFANIINGKVLDILTKDLNPERFDFNDCYTKALKAHDVFPYAAALNIGDIAQTRRIDAVKLVRSFTGLGLGDAIRITDMFKELRVRNTAGLPDVENCKIHVTYELAEDACFDTPF